MTDVINGSGIDDVLPEGSETPESDVLINGGGGDDTLSGGSGDDMINAGGGDDTIIGGEGDDTIRGGGGEDTVIYDFDLIDGTFEFGQDKSYLTFFSELSGTDYLKQIEYLQFNNGTYVVGAVNQSAFVSDLETATDEDTAINIDVSGSVFDIEGDSITYVSASSSMGATVSISASGVISYDPTNSATLQALNGGDQQQDHVTYWVSDAGTGTLVQGAVFIDVSGLDEGINGVAVDGYLSGASVFADSDGDLQLDTGEDSSITDGSGNFELTDTTSNLVMRGGIDTSTGLSFEGALRAPANSSSITSLSSIAAYLLDGGYSLADATSLVDSAFSFSGVDFLNIDPVASTIEGEASGSLLMLKSSQLLNTAIQIASIMEGTGESFDEALQAVFAEMAEDISALAGGTYDLTSSVMLESLIDDVAANLGLSGYNLTTRIASVKADAADVMAVINTSTETAYTQAISDPEFDAEGYLTEVAAVSIVAQDELSEDFTHATIYAYDSSFITAVVGGYTASSLDTKLLEAEASVIDVDGFTSTEAITLENDSVTLDVFSGLDPAYTLTGITNELNKGVGTIVDNQFHWDPGSDFDYLAAGDSTAIEIVFDYDNDLGEPLSSSVMINVLGVNDAPTGETYHYGNVDEDGSFSISLIDLLSGINAADADIGDSFEVIGRANHGGSSSFDGTTFTWDAGLDFLHLNDGESTSAGFSIKLIDESGAISDWIRTDVTVVGATNPNYNFDINSLDGWSAAGSGASTLSYTPINGILGQDFNFDGIADYTGSVTSAPLLDMDGFAAWIRGDLGGGSDLSSIESLFGLGAGYIGSTFTNTDLTAVDGSAIKNSVYLEAGQTLSFEWAMVAVDGSSGFLGTDTAFYIDLNGDMQVLGDQFDVDSSTTEARVIFNSPTWVNYVSFTDFGSQGTNGWQTVELTATSSGDYDIGFGLLNDDLANGSTDLYIDNITIA
jgi:Bacterial Ig domain/Bacterial cadherin-like domain/RTX calcium-binding nonapeptide repeat (4 copies)